MRPAHRDSRRSYAYFIASAIGPDPPPGYRRGEQHSVATQFHGSGRFGGGSDAGIEYAGTDACSTISSMLCGLRMPSRADRRAQRHHRGAAASATCAPGSDRRSYRKDDEALGASRSAASSNSIGSGSKVTSSAITSSLINWFPVPPARAERSARIGAGVTAGGIGQHRDLMRSRISSSDPACSHRCDA